MTMNISVKEMDEVYSKVMVKINTTAVEEVCVVQELEKISSLHHNSNHSNINRQPCTQPNPWVFYPAGPIIHFYFLLGLFDNSEQTTGTV
jgi:hypothetical protein